MGLQQEGGFPGDTVWQAFYNPWGEPYSLAGTIENNLRFPGQFFLIETAQAYNWHRHYDPSTGRYTQPDPLRFVDGPSVYAYVGSSPYMNVDRTGESAVITVGPVAGGFAVADGPLPVGDIIAGGIIAGAVAYDVYEWCTSCPACSPHPAGTVGYIGPHYDHDHWPVGRPHLNLFVVNQNPNDCKCRWNKRTKPGDVAPLPPDPAWVDLNGGFPVLTP